MSFFIALSQTNNLLDLSETEITPADPSIQVQERSGDIPDLRQFVWNPSVMDFQAKGGYVAVTRLEFLRRFTPQERIGARQLATTDPVVADILNMIDLAEDVVLTDPDIQRSLQYLVSVGVLEPTRIHQIIPE